MDGYFFLLFQWRFLEGSRKLENIRNEIFLKK